MCCETSRQRRQRFGLGWLSLSELEGGAEGAGRSKGCLKGGRAAELEIGVGRRGLSFEQLGHAGNGFVHSTVLGFWNSLFSFIFRNFVKIV